MTDFVPSSTFPGVVIHASPRPIFFRDGIEDFDRVELLAAVRSGDYFATLATTLDALSQLLVEANHAERDNLQKIVSDLLYLSSRYEVRKKD